jgi:hypothetical protein
LESVKQAVLSKMVPYIFVIRRSGDSPWQVKVVQNVDQVNDFCFEIEL